MRHRVVIAFLIHVLTLTGVLWALAAMVAATEHAWAMMFALLGAALVVDGIDGPLARHFNVAEVLPRWQGTVMDLVVDYLTYVFVPAFAVLYWTELALPGRIVAAGAICLSAGLYFADTRMKTEDNFFLGFPGVWNVIVFYLMAFGLGGLPGLAVIGIFVALTFIPVKFAHPLRVRRLRKITLSVTVVWAALAIATLVMEMQPGPFIRIGLAACAIYFLGVSLLRTSRLWERLTR
jgi:phosphatidylcholine synthase